MDYLSKYNWKELMQITLLVCAVVVSDYFLATRIFPVTEGWWETYSWMSEHGLKPYVDFPVKFPPLYFIYVKWLSFIVGDGFYRLRMVAIFVHSIEVVVLYLWLRRYAGAAASAFGTAIAAGLVMSNPVYFAKDYHTVVSILMVCVLYILSRVKSPSSSDLLHVACSAILCGFLLLIKQNIGVFFSMSVLVYWGVYYGRNRKALVACVTFFLFYSIPAVLYSFEDGGAWLSIFRDNDAKGDLLIVLFRFILEKGVWIVNVFTLCFIGLFVVLHRFRDRIGKVLSAVEAARFSDFAIYGAGVFAFIVAVNFLSFLVTAFSLAWTVARVCLLNRSNDEWSRVRKIITIPLVGAAYCGTQTAGYNYVSLEFLIALTVAELVDVCVDARAVRRLREAALSSALAFLVAFSPKVFGVGYDWWGLKSGGVLESCRRSLPFPEMEGISTDCQTAKVFDVISGVRADISEGDRIFAYPSIPIVYKLLNVLPFTNPVLWFDVAGTGEGADVVADLDRVLPKYIFWLMPPGSVYSGHFRLRRKDSAMGLVDSWITKKLFDGEYEVLSTSATYDQGSKNHDYDRVRPPDVALFERKEVGGGALGRELSYCMFDGKCLAVAKSEFDGWARFDVKFKNVATYADVVGSNNVFLRGDFHVFYVLKRSEKSK